MNDSAAASIVVACLLGTATLCILAVLWLMGASSATLGWTLVGACVGGSALVAAWDSLARMRTRRRRKSRIGRVA